ncbi:MAG: hypothetical protein J6D06_10535 [Clostridia bacterium]|nr:hypothetical protein [Clostridia bacterium]
MCCLFSSCNTLEIRQPIYEVDLNQKTEVQLTCNQNVYNTFVNYKNGCLILEFSDNGDSYDGLVFTVGKDFCRTTFKDIEYEFPAGKLTEIFFVNELYDFVSSSQGLLTTDNFNESTGCAYVSRAQGTHTFTFEVFENEGNTAYSLKIT